MAKLLTCNQREATARKFEMVALIALGCTHVWLFLYLIASVKSVRTLFLLKRHISSKLHNLIFLFDRTSCNWTPLLKFSAQKSALLTLIVLK